ncbi:MAG TPA: alkaline phosphatase family protein [Terriglobales bacterium]|nr:alkaline phosphatase family protein [Terriglobales bacterium]
MSASFTSGSPQKVQLSVMKAGYGTGTVASSPVGIDCGASCAAQFATGTTVTLIPQADGGFFFDGWSGACSGTGACVVPITAAASVTATFGGSLQSIKHIIFMLQENRSFDQYLGHLPQYFQANPQYPMPAGGIDGEPANASNPGLNGAASVSAYRLDTACVQNQSPFWNESHRDFNLVDPTSSTATLDGFVTESANDALANGYVDVQGARSMGYYDWNELPYYYFMAANFATSDRWFSPVMDRTQPNRMYLLAATSAGHAYPLPPGTPPLNVPTIFDLLQQHGISWKIYVADLDRFSPPTQDSNLNMFVASLKYPQNFVPSGQFFTDVANNTLPAVAMIEPGFLAGLDEHPNVVANAVGGGVQRGSNFVSTLINALMGTPGSPSPSWKDSVFILTWDENGGFYDHVPPYQTVPPDTVPPSDLQPTDICYHNPAPICGFNFTGFRVPSIVVSPFTRKGYVSHTKADYTAILKLIETRFGLPSLTRRDAAQMDMTEFFDFADAPWLTPPSPPAQPANGACYLDHLP